MMSRLDVCWRLRLRKIPIAMCFSRNAETVRIELDIAYSRRRQNCRAVRTGVARSSTEKRNEWQLIQCTCGLCVSSYGCKVKSYTMFLRTVLNNDPNPYPCMQTRSTLKPTLPARLRFPIPPSSSPFPILRERATFLANRSTTPSTRKKTNINPTSHKNQSPPARLRAACPTCA